MFGRQNKFEFPAKDEEKDLALYLAGELDDIKSLPLYLIFSRRYPEPFLMEMLDEVLAVPFERIRKSRGALFNYLVHKYGQQTNHNTRD